MLTLPPFQFHSPKSVAEAVALLGAHGLKAKLIAGGTDLVPNMKHRLFTPEHVIGLGDIDELHRIGERDGALTLGAMVTLANLARDERVRAIFPSLSKAAAQVAGPQ